MSTRSRTRSQPPSLDLTRTATDGRTVDLLAEEALALVQQACSTRIGVRTLEQMAGGEPGLLDTAVQRCNRASDLDHQVRRIAMRLLERAASRLRRVPPDSQADRIHP